MNKKKAIIVMCVAFAVLIGGASVLYNVLGDKHTGASLITDLDGGAQNASKSAGSGEAGGGAENASEGSEAGEAASGNEDQSSVVNPPPPARTEPKAMDFTVYDSSGRAHKLSDYIGKPIVLNFWASWCPPCKGEMPDFHDKYLELGDEVQFLMVNMTGGRETLSSATSFISSNGYTFPVLYDLNQNAADVYEVSSLPTTYFIDADGYLIAKALGAINADVLQQGIDMIL